MQKSRAFHLVVEGYGLAEYWMHLEAPVSETLKDLDYLLRQTWLECCGGIHLSCFVVGRTVYSSFTGDDFFDPSDDESMDFKLGQVLRRGCLKFKYEYDFGDTTELALRVVAETEIPWQDIRLLARNAPPNLACHGKIAGRQLPRYALNATGKAKGCSVTSVLVVTAASRRHVAAGSQLSQVGTVCLHRLGLPRFPISQDIASERAMPTAGPGYHIWMTRARSLRRRKVTPGKAGAVTYTVGPREMRHAQVASWIPGSTGMGVLSESPAMTLPTSAIAAGISCATVVLGPNQLQAPLFNLSK